MADADLTRYPTLSMHDPVVITGRRTVGDPRRGMRGVPPAEGDPGRQARPVPAVRPVHGRGLGVAPAPGPAGALAGPDMALAVPATVSR